MSSAEDTGFQSDDRRTVTIRAGNEVEARLEAEKRLSVKGVHICTVMYVRGETGVRDFTYADRLLQ